MYSSPEGHSTDRKLFGLDHLRALAITLVFFFHYSNGFKHPRWIEGISKLGWVGVDLFFVLSGYLIAGQLFNKMARAHDISLKEFYIKRFFRIIPAYLVVIAVYFSLPSFREKEALPPLWKFLTFTQNFGLDPKNYGTFSHAWSLCVEEQFYLLFPLIILMLSYFRSGKKAAYMILALFILGFVARTVSWNQFVAPAMNTSSLELSYFTWIYYPTYNRLDGLLAGITVAGLFQFYPQLRNRIVRYGNVIFFLGLLFLASAYFVFKHQYSLHATVFGYPLVAIGFGAIVGAAALPSSFLYKYRSGITIHIASLSYAIYLVHKMVIRVTQENLERWGIDTRSTAMLLSCIFFTWLCALLLRYIVEKPFLQLRQIILKKNRLPLSSPISEVPNAVPETHAKEPLH